MLSISSRLSVKVFCFSWGNALTDAHGVLDGQSKCPKKWNIDEIYWGIVRSSDIVVVAVSCIMQKCNSRRLKIPNNFVVWHISKRGTTSPLPPSLELLVFLPISSCQSESIRQFISCFVGIGIRLAVFDRLRGISYIINFGRQSMLPRPYRMARSEIES